jgi:hypothetical protein
MEMNPSVGCGVVCLSLSNKVKPPWRRGVDICLKNSKRPPRLGTPFLYISAPFIRNSESCPSSRPSLYIIISIMASENSYPATGLYSSDCCSSASLVHCSIETSLFGGFEVSIQLGMLFQNNNPHDMEDTAFHCKLDSEDSAMTSFSCCVERSFISDPEARFERRMVKRAAKKGASFQCAVGNIPSGGDVILFIR